MTRPDSLPPRPASEEPPRRPRGPLTLVILALIAAFLFAVLCTLGKWQVQRLAWKENLIEQVESRVHAPAVAAPPRAEWASLDNANAEYRHVQAEGVLRHDLQTLVQAATELGSGYWVMTPLAQADGSLIMVNRGFVLPGWRKRAPDTGSSEPVKVEGLLRMGEGPGGFLRENDAQADRWYSRDLPAIATRRGIDPARVAPYFIDAGASASRDPETAPVGGLTVLSFANHHLGYAITWFALALMVLVGAGIVAREELRTRKRLEAADQ